MSGVFNFIALLASVILNIFYVATIQESSAWNFVVYDFQPYIPWRLMHCSSNKSFPLLGADVAVVVSGQHKRKVVEQQLSDRFIFTEPQDFLVVVEVLGKVGCSFGICGSSVVWLQQVGEKFMEQ